jgi:hypothetical protein
MKITKKHVWGFSILVFIAILYFLPWILSSLWGTHFIEKKPQNKLHLNAIKIESLSLSWFGPQKIHNINMQKEGFRLSCKDVRVYRPLFALKHFTLRSLLEGKLRIEDGTIEVKNSSITSIKSVAYQEKNTLIYKLSAKTNYSGEQGIIDVTGKDGLQERTIKANIQKFPLEIIQTLKDLFLPNYPYSFQKILGSSLDLSANLILKGQSGPVELDVVSPNCSVYLKGNYSSSSFDFTAPFKASCMMSRDLFVALHQKNILKIFNNVESILPMEFLIDQGSSVKWKSARKILFDGTMHVNLAHMKANINQGFLKILNFLPTTFSGKDLDLWFTPVNINVKNEIAALDRCDFLVKKKIHLCTWGKISLFSNEMDMHLGIPVESLFDIVKLPFTPHDKIIVIPIKGTLGHIEIDQELAKNQLALILTQSGSLGGTLSSPFIKNPNEVPEAKPLPWSKGGANSLFNIIKIP